MTEAQQPELHLVEWRHPRHGPVLDVVCLRHEHEVLGALEVLGIGCKGRRWRGHPRCGRCAAEAEGVEARTYLGLAGTR